jgi:type II secretory pathway pseudopilin PulG
MSRVSAMGRREGLSLWSGETGQSLVEELVAVAIVSLGLVILIAALSTGSMGVRTTTNRVTAENLARSQLELIKDTAYSPNPTVVPYPTVTPVQGYNVTMVVEYWIAPSGPFTSTVRDDGLQKLTVSVSGGKGALLQLEGYKVHR